MRQTQQALFGQATVGRLAEQITLPTYTYQGVYKCRIIYQQAIEHVEFIPYLRKPARSLQRVYCDTILYDYKYEDRRLLNQLFAQRGHSDDILIIKNGLVTDTSYANILFYDGQRWVTPDRPLLRGTQRQYLLDQHMVTEQPIKETSLYRFQQYKIINAFRGLESPSLLINSIS